MACYGTIWKLQDYGLGHHMHLVPLASLKTYGKLLVVEVAFYLTAVHALRASVVVFYRSLSTSRTFHVLCWIYLFFNTAAFIVFGTAKFMFLPGRGWLYSNSASLVLLDLWALILPIPAVLRLNVPRNKKLRIMSLFVLSFVYISPLSFVVCVWVACSRVPQLEANGEKGLRSRNTPHDGRSPRRHA